MSILDRSKRWGLWFDRLIEVRDHDGSHSIISSLASEICDIQDQVDILKVENEDMRRTIQAEADAREIRLKYRDREVLYQQDLI